MESTPEQGTCEKNEAIVEESTIKRPIRRKSSATSRKRRKRSCSAKNIEEKEKIPIRFQDLSPEIICTVLSYLPFQDVMKMDILCSTFHRSVSMFLRTITTIDFTSEYPIPDRLTDYGIKVFMERCPNVEYMYSFEPTQLTVRRSRTYSTLSVPGIIDGLLCCKKLKGIEISDIFLLEAVFLYLPQVQILGTFKNRIGSFPVDGFNRLTLMSTSKITNLNLTGMKIV